MRRAAPGGVARYATLVGLCLLLGLGGCDTVSDWFSDDEESPVAGERLSVIFLERQLEPDPGAEERVQPVATGACGRSGALDRGSPPDSWPASQAARSSGFRYPDQLGWGTDLPETGWRRRCGWGGR